MEQSYVKELVYEFRPAEGVIYHNPLPIDVDQEKWEGRLENGILTCSMKAQYSLADARKEIESYLTSWEAYAALCRGRRQFKFVFSKAKPSAGDTEVYGASYIAQTRRQAIAMDETYPPPPEIFRLSPDAESLWRRYEGCLDEKEPLLAMAYFCLTQVESIGREGSGEKRRERPPSAIRKRAANAINVDIGVLNKLGELTSTRGDASTARKVSRDGLLALTGAQNAWIKAVVKRIICRVGERAGCGDCSTLTMITMADFPALNEKV